MKIHGRSDEMITIQGFLDRLPSQRALGMLIEGRAGFGKSTLWSWAVSGARSDGLRVLSARPAEAEAELGHSCLADLLDDVGDDILAGLPPPQRDAIDVALLRVRPTTAIDQRTIGAATLGVLKGLCDMGPLLVAIDDAQWADAPSVGALAYALRRLQHDLIAVVLARRTPLGGGDEDGIIAALPSEAVSRLVVGPLPFDALDSLIEERIPRHFSRPTLKTIHERSGGNPLFGLELARAPALGAGMAPSTSDEDQTGLSGLLERRLSELSPEARKVLLFASVLAKPDASLIETALDIKGSVQPSLTAAASAGIIETIGAGTILFTHPLYSDAVYQTASEEERRNVHAHSALIASDEVEAARHLALASQGPDASVAAKLEEAATQAFRRGLCATAAELSELAGSLTPEEDKDEANRRSLAAADYWFTAGDAARCMAILQVLLNVTPMGRVRAHVLFMLGRARWFGAQGSDPPALLEEALREGQEEPELCARIHQFLYWVAGDAGDMNLVRAHAKAGLERAEETNDPDLIGASVGQVAHLDFLAGRGVSEELVRRAFSLEQTRDARPTAQSPRIDEGISWLIAQDLTWADRLEEARELLLSMRRLAATYGNDQLYPDICSKLTILELRAGNWEEALRYGDEANRVNLETGGDEGNFAWVLGLVQGHLGLVSECRASVAQALAPLGSVSDDFQRQLYSDVVLGFLEWSLDHAEIAADHLARAAEAYVDIGFGEPGVIFWVADAIEALLAAGSPERALRLLDWLDEQGTRLNRRSAIAAAHRCRGLVAAVEGRFDEALELADHAVETSLLTPLPFEQARTLFALGVVRRRAKRLKDARKVLEEALQTFESLGASLWVARAKAELSVIGGRAPAYDSLTPMEDRVAHLVAAGRTNREVADTLFVSVRTVESHLAHAYNKLGIRSRTELAVFYSDRSGSAQEPPTHL